jgi:hypothetical protein
MSKNEANALWISRLLTPEHRGDLLAFVHLSYAVETSARRSLGAFTRETQEYSCRNNAQRSKK